MKSIRGIFVILLAVGLIVVIGVPKLWAQEGVCLMLAQIGVDAMRVGYDTQSYEACKIRKGKIVFKADTGEEYKAEKLPERMWSGRVKSFENGFLYPEDET